MGPDELLASVYRDRWQDYLTNFAPLQDELIATYRNPQIRERMLGDAAARTDQAFDVAQGVYGRTLSRIAPGQDATERAETGRLFGMERSLSQVDARNRTRRALIDQDRQLLAGGLAASAQEVAA